MALLGRLIFRAVSAFLWLTTALLLLEAYAAIQSHLLQSADKTLPTHPSWNPVPSETQPDAASVLPPRAPSPDDESHLGILFADLSEEDRATYASLRDESFVVYDRSGRPLAAYGREDSAPALGFNLSEAKAKSIETLFPSSGKNPLETVKLVLDRQKPEVIDAEIQTPGGTRQIELSLYPLGRPSAAAESAVCAFRDVTNLGLTERMARKQESAKEPLWEIPWFEYRRNAVVGGIRLTNNVGFIDDDVELPKPKGVFRIACVGGSTTMEGGGKDLTYPNILERELRKFFNRNDIEVINCGVGGIDSLGERRRTLDYIRLQPDLIIHYNAVNDICHGLFPLWEKDAPAWQRILRHSAFVNLYLNWLLLPPSTTISEHFDRATFHNLRDMQQCIQAKHIDTAICSFAHPDYASLSRKERRFFESILRKHWQGKYVSFQNYCRLVEVYNAKVRALCQEKGIMYLPVAESIHGGTNFFGDICHMQQAGIERKAEVIFEALKDYVGARLGSKPAQP